MDIIKAFLFGFTLAISVGPIAILIINQSINHGLLNGVKCGLGAALADYLYAFVAFFAGHLVFGMLQDHKSTITLISSLVLILFGLWMVYLAWHKMKNTTKTVEGPTSLLTNKPLLTTFSLTIVNPLTVIVFTGLSGQFQEVGRIQLVIIATALFVGSLTVQLLLALFGSQMSLMLKKPRVLAYLNMISGVVIIGFGLIKLPLIF